MSFLVGNAIAAGASTQAAHPDGSFSLIMIAAIFVLFYFMLIRPQNKRAKEHREMISKLKKGDEIVTTGGLLAKVVNIDENYIRIALAENVEVSIQRGAVSAVLPKGTLKSL